MRKMRLSRVLAPVLGMLLATSGLSARAAELPATAIGDNTFLIAKFDLTKLDPATVRATSKALLGEMAAMAEGGMGEYDKKFKEMTDAGAESLSVVLDSADTKKEPEPVVYVSLKAGSDVAAAKAKVLEEMAKKPAAEQMDIETNGNYLVMHKKGTPAPAGNGARMGEFAPALADAGEKAVVVAFAPGAALKTDMKAQLQKDAPPPPFNTIAPLLIDAKWSTITINLGDAPALALNVQSADAAAAQTLLDESNKGIAQLKAMADAMKGQGPQGQAQAGIMTAIADAIKPSQTGSKLSVAVDLKAVAPSVMQILPMLMMGGGGGGAPPAPTEPPK